MVGGAPGITDILTLISYSKYVIDILLDRNGVGVTADLIIHFHVFFNITNSIYI